MLFSMIRIDPGARAGKSPDFEVNCSMFLRLHETDRRWIFSTS